MTNVAIIGSGGREHALGWNIGKSSLVDRIFFLPGNGGTEEDKGKNIPISLPKENFQLIYNFLTTEKVDLTIVGPEKPLAEGLVDFLNQHGYYNVFGPTAEQTRIESDKFHSYDIMDELGISQAKGIKCLTLSEIERAINEFEQPVLKKRGLAAGKGVRVYESQEDTRKDLGDFVYENGTEVLVSERLYGEEFSVFGLADGTNILPIEIAIQDHKTLYNGDRGPNTGGMGAYGPAPIASRNIVNKVSEKIMAPVVQRTGFKGFLYTGMIMTSEGPKAIEFNARFGDPEAQPAVQLLKDSLYEPLNLAINGRLNEARLDFLPGASCCVVLTSKGYPKNYEIGFEIKGIDEANSIKGVKVFHAGTITSEERILANGGRILGVTAYSDEGLKEAQRRAYHAISKIESQNGHFYRTDIGDKGLK